MDFQDKLSFNRNYPFTEEEIKNISLQLDYANNTDFDFSIIANAYDSINIHKGIDMRKFNSGYYDTNSSTQEECYLRIQFWSCQHGYSSTYHILLNFDKKKKKFYYKGFSKINKLIRNIQKTKTSISRY